MSWKKENKLVSVLLLALVILVPTASYVGYEFAVRAGPISNPGITYGPGDADGYSYLVYVDSGTYYAKNGTTRAIDYSGTNATTIIGNAITVLESASSGGVISIRSGTYDLSGPLVLDSQQITLIGEGGQGFPMSGAQRKSTILRQRTVNAPAIKITGIGYNRIESLMLYSEVASPVLAMNSTSENVINNVVLWSTANTYALNMSYGTYFNRFIDTTIYGGIKLQGSASAGVNTNSFTNLIVHFDPAAHGTTSPAIFMLYASGNSFFQPYMSRFAGSISKPNINLTSSQRNAFFGLYIDNYGAGQLDIYTAVDSYYNNFVILDSESIVNEVSYFDEGYGNTFVDRGFVVLPKITHPSTVSWTANMTGRMWFDTTYHNFEYWNGTHTIYWNATGTGVQP